MSTCAECKFWNRNGDAHEVGSDEADDNVPTGHRRCLRVIHGNGGDSRKMISEPGRRARRLGLRRIALGAADVRVRPIREGGGVMGDWDSYVEAWRRWLANAEREARAGVPGPQGVDLVKTDLCRTIINTDERLKALEKRMSALDGKETSR